MTGVYLLVEELLVSSEKLEQPVWHFIVRDIIILPDCAQGLKDFKEAEKRYGLAIVTAMKYGFCSLWQ